MNTEFNKSISASATSCKEIENIINQLKESFNGDPWFGRSVVALLNEVDEELAFQKPSGQHSMLELLWHMIVWREFTISRIKPSGKSIAYFEEADWQKLDHSDKSLWQQGLQRLHQTQEELINVLQGLDDLILDKTVADRNYDFRKLLYGIVQHDIYHLGQIAYITKMLRSK